MQRTLKFSLTILLIFTLIAPTGLIAKAHHKGHSFKKARAKLCSIIKEVNSGGSIGSVASNGIRKAFKTVRGQVLLLANNSLNSIEQAVFKGNDKKLLSKKAFRVKGFNSGSVIKLRGLGKSGRGYTLSFQSPGSVFCVDKRKVTKETYSPEVFNLSFGNKSIELTEDDPGLDLIKSKGKVIVEGGFTSDDGSGEGRFKLKFSKK